MDFGRVPDVSRVDFTLPPDSPGTASTLAAGRGGTVPAVVLGGPVWANDGFVGTLYPVGAKKRDYLSHYAKQFDAIELNSTWYAVNESAIARWIDDTPASFRFYPKLARAISHDRMLMGVERATERFVDAMRPFGERLGAMWLLLPESFGPAQIADLADFIAFFPDAFELAVELRHPDWFADRTARDDVFALFAAEGVTPVITDTAGRRDVVHQHLTTRHAFIRFAGNQLDPTDFTRLDDWVERLGTWVDRGLERITFFLHQPNEALILNLAAHFVPRLNARCGTQARVPTPVPTVQQGELF